MSTLTSAQRNALPNSSYAWIDPDGNPHLPYKDADGAINASHVRNALARINQVSGLSGETLEKVRHKLQSALRQVGGHPSITANEYATSTEIDADEQGNLPTEIEIMRPVKITKSPTKPDFEVTSDDLDQYAENFKAGVRKGVPVDIEHGTDPKFGTQAAGWVKDIYVKASDTGKSLMAKVEWNDLGKELVGDKRYRFLSPQFVPRSLGAYEDPEGKFKTTNVIKRITVTNGPLFKSLGALSASEVSEESTNGLTIVILENSISATERVEMKLDQVRVKNPSELSADERSFLIEHKSELSASEVIGFGLDKKEKTAEEIAADEAKAKADADAKAAAAKKAGDVQATDGTVTIDASEFKTMKDQIAALEIKANEGHAAKEELKAKEVHDFVQQHVRRGAIKGGEAEATEKMILASEAPDDLKKLIENTPTRTVNAGEVGESDEGTLGNAAAAIDVKVKEIAATEEGKKMTYAEQVKTVIKANPSLGKEYQSELNAREV